MPERDHRLYYQTHKAERRAYYLAHKEEFLARNRRYREERRLARGEPPVKAPKFPEAQKLSCAERDRKYRAKEAALRAIPGPEGDAARERQRKKHLAGKGDTIAQMNRYNARHPERRRARRLSARAEELGVENTLTRYDIRAQVDSQTLPGKDGPSCWYCGVVMPGTTWHLDHLVPMCKGGGNIPGNVVAACMQCNNAKARRMPEEFARRAVDVQIDIQMRLRLQ